MTLTPIISINQFRGRVTILFIAHQVPATLQADCTFDLEQLVEDAGNA